MNHTIHVHLPNDVQPDGQAVDAHGSVAQPYATLTVASVTFFVNDPDLLGKIAYAALGAAYQLRAKLDAAGIVIEKAAR